MVKITSKRYLSWSDVRQLCIDMDWYTCGTTKEYSKLHDMVKLSSTVDDQMLYHIAKDIVEHSEFRPEIEEPIPHAMFYLNERASTIYIVEE